MTNTPRVNALQARFSIHHEGDLARLWDLARQLELDLFESAAKLADYRKTHRWNVREDEDGSLLVCKGEHERAEDCDEVRYAHVLS